MAIGPPVRFLDSPDHSAWRAATNRWGLNGMTLSTGSGGYAVEGIRTPVSQRALAEGAPAEELKYLTCKPSLVNCWHAASLGRCAGKHGRYKPINWHAPEHPRTPGTRPASATSGDGNEVPELPLSVSSCRPRCPVALSSPAFT